MKSTPLLDETRIFRDFDSKANFRYLEIEHHRRKLKKEISLLNPDFSFGYKMKKRIKRIPIKLFKLFIALVLFILVWILLVDFMFTLMEYTWEEFFEVIEIELSKWLKEMK